MLSFHKAFEAVVVAVYGKVDSSLLKSKAKLRMLCSSDIVT